MKSENLLYPGKPNYEGPKSGYFTLLHHEGPLVEWSHDVIERVDYIKSDKAAHEVPVRLRHIVRVPAKMVPKELQKAYAERQKAEAEWQKAAAELRKAAAELRKADAELQKADAEKLLAYLHKHVKDCKWTGKELDFS